mmetsp:Transcript_49177/g.110235  ORF Transcript_49177/g.110235 Transcript_49177/m.110235 type:complete len:307 (-) Transcript_49177:90-1010(-)
MALIRTVLLAFAASVSLCACQERCVCGESCIMESGGTGTCGEDYMTCAHFFAAVVCPALTAPVTLELGDVCNNTSECPSCSSCLQMHMPRGMQDRPTVTTCQVTKVEDFQAPAELDRLDGLDLGDVCFAGGIGVNRRYDCPMESSCIPDTNASCAGCWIDSTCQKASGEVPLGGTCSVSGGMRGRPLPCETGLECVITDPGRPELDLPNAGYCMESSTALPFAAPCIKDGTMCAPTLKCTWTSTMFPSSSGYTCQRLSLDSCEDANERSTSTAEAQAVPAGACASSSGYAFGLVALTSIFLGLGGV